MQLIPKSEDPTSTRTNIKSFLTKFLKNKNKKFFLLVKPPQKKKKIKLVFLYLCKVRYAYVKKSYHFAIIYMGEMSTSSPWKKNEFIFKMEIYLCQLDGKYENKTPTLIK